MPNHRVCSRVEATPETVWAVLLDKMDHPQRYLAEALDADLLERNELDAVRRLMLPGGVAFRERISADPAARTITFTLLDHPVYEGTVLNRLLESPDGGVELAFELDWRLRAGALDLRDPGEPLALIQGSILQTKRIAEALAGGR